ncbi:MAG TPA: TetR/AcrR family transcriptional regulator [Candidatus Poseidoniales archaeon]|nr:MAG TPA: TetR/AcrR family transcriptional regulator [Candidatus Poseidoniales archaeon]HII87298.1 TetR/AcrR family transcriptional regulator [Candidatus Poseidoniaceae archaeon]|tara:strand:+ start:636 stop:1328 length:693 start_codon:yes stop_codon:yes gene_type:complete
MAVWCLANIIFDQPVGPTGRMPLARYESIDESLKTRILEVSKQEFAALGYDDASYNKIISRIGISKGSMYYYFENKEDLFITCFIDEARSSQILTSFTSEALAFSQISNEQQYWQALDEFCVKQWTDTLQHPLLMSLARQLTTLGPSHPIVGKLNAEIEGLSEYGALMNILEHGVNLAAIRSDVPLTVLIRMSSEFEIWLFREFQEGRLNKQEVLDKFIQMFRTLFEKRR